MYCQDCADRDREISALNNRLSEVVELLEKLIPNIECETSEQSGLIIEIGMLIERNKSVRQLTDNTTNLSS